MKIYKELLQQELGAYILNLLQENPPDYKKMVDTKSTQIIAEIQQLFLDSDLISDDFLLVDSLISILNKHGISTGHCHDF